MKKIIILFVMMMAVLNVKAQLKIDSLGIAYITHGTYRSNKAYLNMDGPNQHLYCYMQANTNQIFIPAGEFFSTNAGTGNVLGLKGSAYGNNNIEYAIGIRGFASPGTVNRGIGVQGCLSTTAKRGAGIMGSKTLSGYSSIDSLYAGFFKGLTKVQGDFIVTGNIQGTLLNAPASPSGVNQGGQVEERSSQVMSNALLGLTANTFYHELSDEMLRALNADCTTKEQPTTIDYNGLTDEEGRTLEEAELNAEGDVVPELSAIEKQILTKQHYGLDADQLKEVFPDLVYEDENGIKSINYVEMVPILVQAINELSAKVEMLEGGSTAKKAQTKAASADGIGDNIVMLSLGQNKPNPFGTTTSIDVCIPESVQKAFIYVYDLQGKKVEQVDIVTRGKQTVQLNAAILSDGMYLYSLIADGKVVETRRMIVEK